MKKLKKNKRNFYQCKKSKKYYKGIEELSTELYKIYSSKPNIFCKLPKNKSIQCKKICKTILQKRLKVNQSDIYNIAANTDVMAYIQAADNNTNIFYILHQIDIIRVILQLFSGDTLSDKQRPTDNDRIHVMGILFSEEFCSDFLPLLLDSTATNRAAVNDPSLQKIQFLKG